VNSKKKVKEIKTNNNNTLYNPVLQPQNNKVKPYYPNQITTDKRNNNHDNILTTRKIGN